MEQNYGFFTRLSMAFKMIFSGTYTRSLLQPAPADPVAPQVEIKENNQDSALQLISLLQKEGRLVDFINEDINSFADEQVAAAARVVHQGVKKALAEHVSFAPVSETPEGESITLGADYNRSQWQLTGNVAGQPPFTGTVIHKGWQVTEMKLPAVVEGTNLKVVAAAEVEL